MRKSRYIPKRFESAGTNKDTSANIYESMLLSDAWKDLTDKARYVYLCCKAQYYGKRKPAKDFPEMEQFQSEMCFYFSKKDFVKYAICTQGNEGRTYKHIDSLIQHGFIECISNGQAHKKKSIYKFSHKWQTWKK